MGKCLKVNEKDALNVYENADEAGKKCLEQLFGKQMFKTKNAMDRVKSFEDACHELGEDDPLVRQYARFELAQFDGDDVKAYMKLRIIVAALNDGWKPDFSKDEVRYYPWFWIYTEEEFEELDESEKDRAVLFGGSAYSGAYAGSVFSSAISAPSYRYAYFGSRLCLKNEELATYCVRQFVDIWAKYLLN